MYGEAVERTHDFGYNPAVESLRLIDHGLPRSLPGNLSGRFRFTPASLYVGDRIAATAFARLDGFGLSWVDVWLLSFHRGRWALRAGDSMSAARSDDLLAHRQGVSVLKEHGLTDENGRFDTNAGRWMPRPKRWVAYGLLRLSAEVETVRLAGREVPVPGHGLQALAWRLQAGPVVAALLDDMGETVAAVSLTA